MTTPDPTPTPAHVLELLARYLEANNRWAEIQEAPGYDSSADTQAEQNYINALRLLTELDPNLIRAQAEALAEREAEAERLRVAAREMLALQDGPQDAAYRELLPIVLRNLRAALTPTQEAPQ